MKFKKIESILKNKRTLIICKGPDCQWLGDGTAFYPCYNFPNLDEKTLPLILDITDTQIEKYTIQVKGLPKRISFLDTDKAEVALKRGAFEFVIDGMHLEPIGTSQGIVFINTKYLKPYADEKEGVQLYERTNEVGDVYIAVKKGFMLIGIIAPINIVDEQFIATIENVLNSSRVALGNARQKIAKQPMLDEM